MLNQSGRSIDKFSTLLCHCKNRFRGRHILKAMQICWQDREPIMTSFVCIKPLPLVATKNQNQVDPIHHCFFYPSFWLASVYAIFWVCLKLICFHASICLSLKINKGFSNFPLLVTVVALVASLLSAVQDCMWLVLIHFFSRD